jgi:hypothetical protein
MIESFKRRLAGDFGEEPLDEVEPGAGRRREMQDEAFVSCQPAFHGWCLMGGVCPSSEFLGRGAA